MDIIEAIRNRRSVRTFDGQPLSAVRRDELTTFAANVYNPFGGQFSIRLKTFDLASGFKPSTYGMIKGAVDFFTLGISDDEMSALAAGFGFEQVVLKATQLDLGTCWIAATFKGTCFDDGHAWPDGESLKIVCPVGTAAKKSLVEKIARTAVRSDKRRPFSSLFFDGDFSRPLTTGTVFDMSLEMLRLAPSSTNSQPWRAIVCGTTVHFYYVPKSKCSVLDCGIGLCHFYETEKFLGHDGQFFTDKNAPAGNEKMIYLRSYSRP